MIVITVAVLFAIHEQVLWMGQYYSAT